MAAHRQRSLVSSGTRAPDVRFARLDGGDVGLKELIANGPVLLVFFKISCPVCQMTLPVLDRIHQPGALTIQAISQNDPEDTREFNRRFGIALPTLLDREEDDFPASNAFGISTVPTMFLIERDGTISRVMEGWSRREIEWLGGQAGVAPFRKGENVPEWKAG